MANKNNNEVILENVETTSDDSKNKNDKDKTVNLNDMTPKEIVKELDKYIIGQDSAKKSVALALRNRYRRNLLDEKMKEEVTPKNILMIGPTGVGKTEIARRLAKLMTAPFVKVEATKFTEVGYVGRNVESMVKDLVEASLRLEKQEKFKKNEKIAREKAIEKIAEIIIPPRRIYEDDKDLNDKDKSKNEQAPKTDQNSQTVQTVDVVQPDLSSLNLSEEQMDAMKKMADDMLKNLPGFGQNLVNDMVNSSNPNNASDNQKPNSNNDKNKKYKEVVDDGIKLAREQVKRDIREGKLDDQMIKIKLKTPKRPKTLDIDDGIAIGNIFDIMGGSKNTPKEKEMSVKNAIKALIDEEVSRLIDKDDIVTEALHNAEQNGIIFIDEIDKVAGGDNFRSANISREGVQRDILPIVEGSVVKTKYGPVKTDHILFIGAGAFHISKPTDLIPELQGRFPIRVTLENLSEETFYKILTVPVNSLIKQHKALLETEGVKVNFDDESIKEIAKIAYLSNEQTENIGARRLHTVMEKLLEDISFTISDSKEKEINIDKNYVDAKFTEQIKTDDVDKYIL